MITCVLETAICASAGKPPFPVSVACQLLVGAGVSGKGPFGLGPFTLALVRPNSFVSYSCLLLLGGTVRSAPSILGGCCSPFRGPAGRTCAAAGGADFSKAAICFLSTGLPARALSELPLFFVMVRILVSDCRSENVSVR